VLAFFARQAPAVIGMEACGSAHYWARELKALGLSALAKTGEWGFPPNMA